MGMHLDPYAWDLDAYTCTWDPTYKSLILYNVAQNQLVLVILMFNLGVVDLMHYYKLHEYFPYTYTHTQNDLKKNRSENQL